MVAAGGGNSKGCSSGFGSIQPPGGKGGKKRPNTVTLKTQYKVSVMASMMNLRLLAVLTCVFAILRWKERVDIVSKPKLISNSSVLPGVCLISIVEEIVIIMVMLILFGLLLIVTVEIADATNGACINSELCHA